MPIYESDIEEMQIEILSSLGYVYLSPEEQETEREDLSEVVLKNRLRQAIARLNPDIPTDAQEDAFKQVLNLPSQNLIENNEHFHRLLTEGVPVEYNLNGDIKGDVVRLVDFENAHENDLIVCNQYSVRSDETRKTKRPDVVLLINGLPLVVIELKNASDEHATIEKAFNQLQNYKEAIPQLFYYNALLIASDGHDAKAGSLTAGWSRFMAWKSADGKTEERGTIPQIVTLCNGMLGPDTLLDLIKQFTVFEKNKSEDSNTGQLLVVTIKKIAAYHQYYAVNKALASTKKASSENGSRKAGVIWHTQGSGKSLSMVFYAGKTVIELDNPTLVIITDRNDLDDQLFGTFASCKQLLRQDPVQAKDRHHLKELLKTSGGGIIFTTIQKFSPEENSEVFELLSDRKNIVVIADEAHRSQYGFSAKTTVKEREASTRYGFAKYLRDAIPNASFIGFTGTPIEKEDASTPAVFGNYIDVYDIERAVEDGATVRIYYESRLAKVHLKAEEQEKLDEEVDAITEGEESTYSTSSKQTAKEKAKAKWAQLEAIVGHKDRLRVIAEDIVQHFEQRQEAFEGKAMIVTMSRRIAVELYEQIIQIKPEWHSKDKTLGELKVIMTSSSSDPQNWQIHNTSKKERKALADRLKDPSDELKIAIVRDMWLTGFDAPCVKTMYIDKPMRGHNLMQAIARVNRVYKNVDAGLIVDYIGIASDLKRALNTYTDSGGEGQPTLDQEEAVAMLLEKFEIVEQMMNGFDYQQYFSANTQDKLQMILEAQEHIMGLEDGKNRFTKQVTLLSKSFAISVPHLKALELKESIGFFQAVKARLVKFEPSNGKSDAEIETAIRQIVDRAVVAEGVVDIFDAAGIKRPDISILSDEFLEEIKGMERKNIAIELLKKLLNDEIKGRTNRNIVQSKKLSEMLEKAIRKYQNNLITSAEVIEMLIDVAKEVRSDDERAQKMGLSNDEIAFYDAIANNDSAKKILGDDQLRELARILVEKVKSNTTIDWTIKENVKANLRVIVKRTLRQFGYPPDQQKMATEIVLKQAEALATYWVSE